MTNEMIGERRTRCLTGERMEEEVKYPFNPEIEKERGNSCRKNEEISGRKTHINTQKLN